jgi:hypothetical protein
MGTLFVGLLLAGFTLGRVVTGMETAVPTPSPSPLPSMSAEPQLAQTLPIVDVDGSDFAELPRPPEAVRTRYQVRADGAASATEVEYLAIGTVEEVREFYRRVFVDYGWAVTDIQLGYDELVYLVAKAGLEGSVDLESRGGGVVEIDVELVTLPPSPTPSPSPAPTPAPEYIPPPPPPPATPPEDDE